MRIGAFLSRNAGMVSVMTDSYIPRSRVRAVVRRGRVSLETTLVGLDRTVSTKVAGVELPEAEWCVEVGRLVPAGSADHVDQAPKVITAEARVPLDVQGWSAVVSYRLEAGAVTPGVRFEADGPDVAGVSLRALMRALGLGGRHREVERDLRGDLVGLMLPMEWHETRMATVRKPGRTGRTDAELALWARRYVEALAAVNASEGRSVYAVMAERWPGYAYETLKGYVRQAREPRRGLLTDPPGGRGRGRQGGELTPKALALLADNEGGQ